LANARRKEVSYNIRDKSRHSRLEKLSALGQFLTNVLFMFLKPLQIGKCRFHVLDSVHPLSSFIRLYHHLSASRLYHEQ